jgi:hypothetical protein
MPAVLKKVAHGKPFVGEHAESRAVRSEAKADVAEEELVKCTRRAAGIKGTALQYRKVDQSREGPGDQPWMVQAAGTLAISAEHEMRVGGIGIGPWARSSDERG